MLLNLARQVTARLKSHHLLPRAGGSRSELEKRLRDSEDALQEKEIIIQEIHHRVRNSLQLVGNLLILQGRAIADQETGDMLRQSAARVHTIAAIHARLYRAHTAFTLDVKPYLEELTAELQTGLAGEFGARRIVLNAEPAFWPASNVQTLGLVMTELVTNALKYGRGLVEIGFRHPSCEQAFLTIEDEGRALPEDFEATKSNGFGMRLVIGLLKPAGGSFEVIRDRGHTCFKATFPLSFINCLTQFDTMESEHVK